MFHVEKISTRELWMCESRELPSVGVEVNDRSAELFRNEHITSTRPRPQMSEYGGSVRARRERYRQRQGDERRVEVLRLGQGIV